MCDGDGIAVELAVLVDGAVGLVLALVVGLVDVVGEVDVVGDVPVRVWLECQHDSDRDLPLRSTPRTTVQWLDRGDKGQALRRAASELSCGPGAYAWVACEFHTTRDIVKSLKSIHKIPKSAIKSQAYWK